MNSKVLSEANLELLPLSCSCPFLKAEFMSVRHVTRVARCHSLIYSRADVKIPFFGTIGCLESVFKRCCCWAMEFNQPKLGPCGINLEQIYALTIESHFEETSPYWCSHRMLTRSYPWRLNTWLVSCLHAENSVHGTFLFLHFYKSWKQALIECSLVGLLPSEICSHEGRRAVNTRGT